MTPQKACKNAYSVAKDILYIAHYSPYRHLVSNEMRVTLEYILSRSEVGLRQLDKLHSRSFVLNTRYRDKWLIPGQSLQNALCKHAIEQMTREALSSGIEQVIVLGAGFDPLSTYLAQQYPKVHFFEVDHPYIQQFKREDPTLRSANARSKYNQPDRDNLHFLEFDSHRHDLIRKCRTHAAFDDARPTLFICEHLLMHLNPALVSHVLACTRTLTGRGTRILMTASEPPQRLSRHRYDPRPLYQQWLGAPVRWHLDSQHAVHFLQRHHYQLLGIQHTTALKTRFIAPTQQPKLQGHLYLMSAVCR
ncbi:hypothetical protein BFW38_08350 [Terasakiispira papahanaumokuakeensis]|uniref:S-adenosyl-L-methionine-dependent methyltransferase n=1 Tax=Terasakiispira papahanaumokuakeensis TaxID=197479 RepID=A0A1E2V9A7_9GAMM|nr:class I SAM-dependent methyltransferase [Terasakiispira papahanaumokuakeensis]ODC03557.1 hypothetical protein BFW38_08350 [Terasakiispira papahanaumokuakeensis]